MAFTFTKEPTGIYPVYNDSFLEFSSNLAANVEGHIDVAELGGDTFTVNPDASGKYLFNLKEIAKSLINSDGFRDPDDSFPAGWGASYLYGYQELNLTVRATDAGAGSDSTSKTYYFIRGAKQIGEVIFVNPAQLLNYSDGGVNYRLTYWEGYPFSFELQRLTAADSLTIKNVNTGLTGTALVAPSTGTYRVHIDKVAANWSSAAYLALPDNESLLELSVNAILKTNLFLKKVVQNRGVYLKWFNADGGYSYFLFEHFYREEVRSRSIGTVNSNSFENVGSAVAPSRSLGKSGEVSYTLKATVDDNEVNIIRSLFTSPSVQMWSKTEPMLLGEFIDVDISSSFSVVNKKNKNDVRVKITLPELITPIL